MALRSHRRGSRACSRQRTRRWSGHQAAPPRFEGRRERTDRSCRARRRRRHPCHRWPRSRAPAPSPRARACAAALARAGREARTRARVACTVGRPRRRPSRRTRPWRSGSSCMRACAARHGPKSTRGPAGGSACKAAGPRTPSWRRGSGCTHAEGSDWSARARANTAEPSAAWWQGGMGRLVPRPHAGEVDSRWQHTSAPPPSLCALSSSCDSLSSSNCQDRGIVNRLDGVSEAALGRPAMTGDSRPENIRDGRRDGACGHYSSTARPPRR